jgi:hypothetical protein
VEREGDGFGEEEEEARRRDERGEGTLGELELSGLSGIDL